MYMISPNIRTILILLFLFNVQANAQSSYAVRLKATNISKQCSTAKPIFLKLTRYTYSVNRRIEPNKPSVFGIFVGEYSSTVTDTDSNPIEKARLRVRSISCEIPFGCPSFMPDAPQKNVKTAELDFYNTTNDCLTSRAVSVAIDGRVMATIKPGEHKKIMVPEKSSRIEIIHKNQRLMMGCVNPKIQAYEFYGCTDPRYPKKLKNSVKFSFKNSTQTCGKSGGFPVVLWVDGFPVQGLKPRQSTAIVLTRGHHRIRISKRLTGESLFNRSMDCSKSFLFNYGCGK